jgi:hypothetical protein
MDDKKPTDTTKQSMGTENKEKDLREQTSTHEQDKTKRDDGRTAQHPERNS